MNSLINVFTMFIHILILWYVSKTRIENEYLEQLIQNVYVKIIVLNLALWKINKDVFVNLITSIITVFFTFISK